MGFKQIVDTMAYCSLAVAAVLFLANTVIVGARITNHARLANALIKHLQSFASFFIMSEPAGKTGSKGK